MNRFRAIPGNPSAYRIYVIQALLAVDPSKPEWSQVAHTAFTVSGSKDYIINHDSFAKFFTDHSRVTYMGGRFWTDCMAFTDPKVAANLTDAIAGLPTCKYPIRVVEVHHVETIEIYHVPNVVSTLETA